MGDKDCRVLRFEIPVPLKPLNLRPCVAIGDITFVVLETPWRDDQHVTFTYPEALFYLPLYPTHPGYPVSTSDRDMVGTKHRFGPGKDLPFSFSWQPYADDLGLGSVL